MTDHYGLGLSADKLWSPEELRAPRAAAAKPQALCRGSFQHVEPSLARHGLQLGAGLGIAAGLAAVIYALSPGGLIAGLATLAFGLLTLGAAAFFRVWDELRLLNGRNRGQNPSSADDHADLP
jgi:predicted lipid-binding transport protein (Tim44 family)